jgi:alkanesulfonate monooxygenase SsuD/methylene tetrahydromethanopterin reductase-like flavin-dependent oxidoreductase (luciferase family)
MKPKIGVFVPQDTFYPDFPADFSPARKFESTLEVAREAEKLGFDSVWAWDSILSPNQHVTKLTPQGSKFEPWVVLSAIAAATRKVRIGHLVLNNLLRHPALVASMGATLDAASGGRFELGIGAGWAVQQSEMGLPRVDTATSIVMLEESIQVIRKLWTEDKVTFKGKFYNLKEATNYFRPVQRPHPPIIVGGGGEKLTLRVVARQADKYNFYCTVEEYRHKAALLKKYCREEGRRYSSIEKTLCADIVIAESEGEVASKLKKLRTMDVHRRGYDSFVKRRINGTPDQCLETIRRFMDVGVSQFMLYFPDSWQLDSIKLFNKQVKSRLK